MQPHEIQQFKDRIALQENLKQSKAEGELQKVLQKTPQRQHQQTVQSKGDRKLLEESRIELRSNQMYEKTI